MTIYNQETSLYCGPACCKAIMKYLVNKSVSQKSVADKCEWNNGGTWLSYLCTYLNDNQNKNIYAQKYDATKVELGNAIYNGICDWDAPPLLGLKFLSSSGWAYSTSGHYVVASGIMSDRSTVKIGDPNIRSVNSSCTTGQYHKSMSDVYNAYSSADIGMAY